MTKRGHNERSYRLDTLADEAKKGLKQVEEGEEFSVNGWLAYGYALNEGRSLFPSDEQFGQWLVTNNLSVTNQAERAAAMWAAANSDQFEEARQRGNPRTIRGIHAKWKEIEAERIEAERSERAEAGRAKQVAPEPETVRGSNPDQEQGTTTNPKENMVQEPVEQDESTAESCGDQEPQADPHSKLRAEFRRLTPEAQEDDWIGLRRDLEESRQREAALADECAELKSRIRDLSEGNQGRAISRLHAQIVTLKDQRAEAVTKAAREIRRANFMEKERNAARKGLEMQEVEI